MLTEKQRGVLKGVVIAVTTTILGFSIVIFWSIDFLSPQQAFPEILFFSLKWDLLIAICLAINIGMLARHRFFSEEDIDGGGLNKNSTKANILQSTLQNTLEQATLSSWFGDTFPPIPQSLLFHCWNRDTF